MAHGIRLGGNILIEIKNYKLNPGIEGEILYTYVRVGKRDFYLEPAQLDKIKYISKMCILCLTFASASAILYM